MFDLGQPRLAPNERRLGPLHREYGGLTDTVTISVGGLVQGLDWDPTASVWRQR